MQPKEISINGRTKMRHSEEKRIKDLWHLCTRTSNRALGQVLHQLLSMAMLQENHDMPWERSCFPSKSSVFTLLAMHKGQSVV